MTIIYGYKTLSSPVALTQPKSLKEESIVSICFLSTQHRIHSIHFADSPSKLSSLVCKRQMGTLAQFLQHRKLLFDQGFLDNQFIQLQMLQDESNPDFVVEVVSVFFDDSERILNDLYLTLNELNVDFKKVDAHVHQLKGSSSSIGAQRVKNACVNFRGFCERQDVQSCRACLQQVKQEYFIIKENLQKLLMMEQQIVSAGGSIPPMDSSSD